MSTLALTAIVVAVWLLLCLVAICLCRANRVSEERQEPADWLKIDSPEWDWPEKRDERKAA